MTRKVISQPDPERWNVFVKTWPEFVLMQSYEWGMFKENLGWKSIRIAVEEQGSMIAGAQMLIKSLPLKLASFAYIPRGPLVDWADDETVLTLLASLHDEARRQRAVYIQMEPAIPYHEGTARRIEAHGFKRSHQSNQPQCTTIVDLTPDIDEILAAMRKSTRRNIRRSERDGVVVRQGDTSDLPVAFELLQHTARRAGFPERSFEYYQEEWRALSASGMYHLHIAEYQGKAIAMTMDAALGGKAASLHSGSLEQHHHLKANDLLIWQYIQVAKAQGCESYDLWGVPDEVGEYLQRGEAIPDDLQGGLWGIYYYKQGFGGRLTNYVGAYDFVYSEFLYRSMQTAISVLGSLDKFARLGDRLT